MIEQVKATIATHGLLRQDGGALVALSGGPDSVALLLALHELGYHIEAAHCNFHLRGRESDRDEAFCRELTERLAIRLHVCHFNTQAEAKAHGESIEMAARRLRYAWFERLINERGLEVVCVGHHQDDDAETLLLNLVRGTGIHGLTGMAYRRDKVVRPLLDVSRQMVTDYLDQHRQPYVCDSSNADTAFKRNLIRHEVMPLLQQLNPAVVKTLRADMRKLRAAEEAYDHAVAETFDRLAHRQSHGWYWNKTDLTLQAHYDALQRLGLTPAETEALRQDNLKTTRARFETAQYVVTSRHGRIEATLRPPQFVPVVLQTNGAQTLPDGCQIDCHETTRDEIDSLKTPPTEAIVDADCLNGPLIYRALQEGDRFRPFGMKGSRLVSDFLTDRHLTATERAWVGVVCDTEGIVWLAGHRIDHRVAVTAKTRRIVKLTLT